MSAFCGVTVVPVDTNSKPGGAPAYTERDVTTMLDSQGGRLYWYFWLMLGDETAVTRALAGTVIASLPYLPHRELIGVARTVCRQYRPAPAVPFARPEAPTLAAATKAALRRLEPRDREICLLGAPAYRLNDADLGAVFGTWEIEPLLSRPMNAFASALAACASDVGLNQDDDLVTRAWRLAGTGQVALPYDEIVPLAIDPGAEWLREQIRSSVAASGAPALARQGMRTLGTESHQSVAVHGMQESAYTIPMPRTSRKTDQHNHRKLGAMAGGVLVAGAIPVALALAWVGSSHSPDHLASPPLSATVHGSQQTNGSASQAGGAAAPAKSGAYAPKHARTGRAAQPSASAAQAGTAGAAGTTAATGATSTAATTGTTTTGTTTTGTTTTGTTTTTPPPTTTTTPPPTTTTTPPPTTTTTPPPTTTTVTPLGNQGNGNGQGNGGVGNGNGNGNVAHAAAGAPGNGNGNGQG